MLTPEELSIIEENAVDNYLEDISNNDSDFSDEELRGDIPNWYDADSYRLAAAKCILPGEVIQQWLYESDFVDMYLKTKDARSISECILDSDKEDPDTFYQACIDVCDDAKNYWFNTYYPDKCDEYFDKNAEPIDDSEYYSDSYYD